MIWPSILFCWNSQLYCQSWHILGAMTEYLSERINKEWKLQHLSITTALVTRDLKKNSECSLITTHQAKYCHNVDNLCPLTYDYSETTTISKYQGWKLTDDYIWNPSGD